MHINCVPNLRINVPIHLAVWPTQHAQNYVPQLQRQDSEADARIREGELCQEAIVPKVRVVRVNVVGTSCR